MANLKVASVFCFLTGKETGPGPTQEAGTAAGVDEEVRAGTGEKSSSAKVPAQDQGYEKQHQEHQQQSRCRIKTEEGAGAEPQKHQYI